MTELFLTGQTTGINIKGSQVIIELAMATQFLPILRSEHFETVKIELEK